MDASSLPPDAERELNDLRARAYGPDPDIQVDPAALGRLAELEAAHASRALTPPGGEVAAGAAADDPARAAAPADAASPADLAAPESPDAIDAEFAPTSMAGFLRSLRKRVTATRSRRISLVAGTAVAVLALAYSVTGLVGPHPDATLRPTTAEADGQVLGLIAFLGGEMDIATLRGFEPYRGVEPWFGVDTQGLLCLLPIERSSGGVTGANCVPPGADLYADLGAWPYFHDDYAQGLPDGSIIRFHYRGDSVDVFLYPASGAD